ncbi:caspase, EACC1-associated type [Nocardia sp. CDC160]|uniref:caspase, EACC1-associated type n=1 Tax=Nocardia sp. CDC160 TaxID=3112166 RepID=UPI002DB575E0|nr:AAA domain-containing protein [Nocardia sp. CDC160]MEC3915833.1 AAA domain-containing protein [Nocardia sp. CDC160]
MSRPLRRRALLIGTEIYADGRFEPLPSVGADTWLLEQVLKHRQIGQFWPIRRVADLTTARMREEIAQFFQESEEDELAFLYLSGHGVRDPRTSEFYFVTTDTDRDRVAETALPAGDVNGLVEGCVADQKIVMIDCCKSGGFAVGFRTSDRPPKGTSEAPEQAVLDSSSRGVYILSSSRAGQDSFGGSVTEHGIQPSVFTGEVIEALRTGKAALDGSGLVPVDHLFKYVNERMRAAGRQVPVKSGIVDDAIIIASCPQGVEPQLAPLKPRPAGRARTAPSPGRKSVTTPGWPELIAYYRNCVEAAALQAALLSVEKRDDYVCLPGVERFLSGDLDMDDCVAVPDAATDLIARLQDEGGELWTGYPAVYFDSYPHSRDRKVFAPLLIRRVEVVVLGDETRLRPTGPVLPHPRLAADFLGGEQAEYFVETYQPTWHAGQHDKMARDIRYVLMQDFGLAQVQELHPDRLAPAIDTRTLPHGARNVAVLYLAELAKGPTTELLKDLAEIEESPGRIEATALAALAPSLEMVSAPAPECDPQSIRLVTPMPCNDAQESVIRSAMAHRLTVATGPPGTGKSQLVVNLVATAVASGQKVLVASTNNTAVDEVWGRCDELVEGSVVRTGSWANRGKEADLLGVLRVLDGPETTAETASAELDWANFQLAQWQQSLSEVAGCEQALLWAGQERERSAGQLGLSVTEVLQRLGETELDDVVAKAGGLAVTKYFPKWRRKWYLRGFGFEDSSAEMCTALAGFARAEGTWRSAERRRAELPLDSALHQSLDSAEAAVRAASAALLDRSVRTAIRAGQPFIAELHEKLRTTSEWKATRNALPYLRAWAVTCLKARRFPPDAGLFDLVVIDEASQCAIPYVLPLLFRARRALIIGDPMQLQHIPGIDANQEGRAIQESGLSDSWLDNRRLSYLRDSSFHAAQQAIGGHLLLDEHFRCHPDIADVANRLFYGGQLTVLTDMRGRPRLRGEGAIEWRSVSGHAEQDSRGSWINEAEVSEVVETVGRLLAADLLPPTATIGVVTPFRAQAEAIGRKLNGHRDRVRVGTVHIFQGGECDIMLFSLVATRTMAIRSIDWIDKQLNLWNVAITRARCHLLVIGDPGVWENRRVTRALITAGAGEAAVASGRGDELLTRLYRAERVQPGAATVQLAAPVLGHRADIRIDWNDESVTALLLDRGSAPGVDPARHVRMMLRRCELLNDLADRTDARRVPAWELYRPQ